MIMDEFRLWLKSNSVTLISAIGGISLLALWSPNYAAHLLVMMGIYLLLSYGLNLTLGFGGLIVFCHAAFYGIGAYTYALVRLRGGSSGAQVDELLWTGDWNWLAGVLMAFIGGALLAALIGWVCLRFRGDYFIFATLGFQMIIFVVLYNWVNLSRGPFGIHGIPRPVLFGWEVNRPWEYVGLLAIVLCVVLPWFFRLYKSPFGLAVKTLREDERAAQAMGTSTSLIGLKAMALAGGLAGLAGGLYAGYVTYIDPTSFSLRESIFLVTLLMLGGSGNLRGPLVGTAVMLLLPEALRFMGMPDAVAANVREMIYGLLLVVLMLLRPQGLAGETLVK